MHNTLTLSPLTNAAILIMALGQLLLVGAIVFLAFKLKSIVSETVKQTLDATLPRVQPTLDNATRITGQVSDIVATVAPKVQSMASDSATAVHTVTTQVKATSNIVTEGVGKPLANFAAVLAGVQRGFAVWKTAKRHQDGAGTASEPEATSQS